MSDPFEDATQSNTSTAPSTNAVSNAVPAGALSNTDDPFGTTSEYKGSGGQWDPRVSFEDLEGKLIIMKPTSFDPKASKPEDFRAGPEDTTREEYRVELWILNGAPFTFEHKKKDAQGNETVESIAVDPSAGTKIGDVLVPGARFRSQSIPQGQLIGALKGVDKDGRVLMGVMSRVPTVTDARKGKTPEDVKSERAAWLAGGARGNAPRSTWSLDDRAHVLTAKLKQVAGAWWGEYRKTV